VNKKTLAITTIAGNGSGVGKPGAPIQCDPIVDGVKATEASLCSPAGLAVDSKGNIYFADSLNNVVSKILASSGLIVTVAGTGLPGYSGDGGLAVNAELNNPTTVGLDETGNVYIADGNNCALRLVDATSEKITSLIGSAGPYDYPTCGIPGDGPLVGNWVGPGLGMVVYLGVGGFITDFHSYRVFAAEFNPAASGGGSMYAIAGKVIPGQYGAPPTLNPGYTGDGGPATNATLNLPESIAVDASGDLYIADTANHVVRKVTEASVLPIYAPTIDPASVFYPYASTPATVTITPATGALVTYVTLDGSLPNTDSPKYTGPIPVTDSTVVTTFSTISGRNDSRDATAASFNSPASVAYFFNAPAPTITPGSKTTNEPTTVTIADANPKAQITYSLNGHDWFPYTAPIKVPVDTHLQAVAYVTLADFQNNVVGTYSATTTAAYTNTAKPVVTTQAATLINPTYATLNGTVTPNSAATTYWFAYGTGTGTLENAGEAFGLTGTAPVPVSFNVTNLAPKTRYDFQVVAQNAANPTEIAKGAILSFTTPAAPAD
jgi:hypothetical protein